jgi:hypothetical protein
MPFFLALRLANRCASEQPEFTTMTENSALLSLVP